MKKKNVLEQYKLPKEVKFCKICTISNQRPRINFDKMEFALLVAFLNLKKRYNWKLEKTNYQNSVINIERIMENTMLLCHVQVGKMVVMLPTN